jgi:CMP-N,N'-diacetyllegionaminic acid synthase
MYKKKKIIAIIPARSGSKRLVNKNIRNLNGKSLIEWTIASAKSSKLLDKIFVSTDSKKIRDIAIGQKINIPFMRPLSIAIDKSPTWELVIHALEKFRKKDEKYDYIALLEPTSPLRKKNDIDNAIKKIVNNSDAETLISLGKIQLEHPIWSKRLDFKNYVKPYFNSKKKAYQSQQLKTAYFPYGVIYLSTVKSFYKKKNFYTKKTIPYFIERWQNYEVDDILDLKIIEKIMKYRRIKNG